MRLRPGRIALGVVSGLVLLVGARADLPKLSDGAFWSDAASYHAMAGSLAFDHDLEFRPEDLARTRASHPAGPQGVFLKRVPDRAGGTRLVYAKPFLYPAAAAPLVRLTGVDRGLVLLNALVLVASLWLGYGLLREAFADSLAAASVLAVFLGGITPVYLLWETPEIFYLGLVTLGLFLWRRGHWLAAAVILGAAAYGKPTNAALALPLVLEPLLADAGGGARRWRSRFAVAGMRAAVVAAVVACGYGLNWAATGELNYQGGERKTFYDRYPGDPGTTFDSAGVWMTTNHLGPLVAGRDDAGSNPHVAPPRTSGELRQAFALNLLLFWIGRFAGGLPYFPGVVLSAMLFLLIGPRGRVGWLALVALVASWIGYLLLIPDNWYGGGGTLGNRYFLNLVPLGLLLLPRGRAAWAALAALPVAAVLLGPMFLSPVYHSLRPGEHATAAAFRVLPAELTMLGDLSVFTDVWRKHRPYNLRNLRGGDPARRAPGDPAPYYLWFLDDGTFGQESSFGEEGFWLRGCEPAEVVVQALAPVRRLRLLVRAGPAGDIVTARLGRDRKRAVLRPLQAQALVFEPREAPVGYYGTELYPLRLGSRFGASTERDRRRLGAFVTITLEP
ncbi:MAG TPA: hypothetical protein VEQ10_21265 [Vicinamibacteria bacterium]|nr:hypothetical protein [Vicinamibacteria bacterium]